MAIAAAHGALDAARNDDWTYFRTLFETAQTGIFRGDAYTLAFLAGQIYFALPLAKLVGPSLAGFQVLVALLGAGALWAAYDVVRSFLSRGWALFSVGVLALGPVYGSVSVTFMTDVPSFFCQALALCLGRRALSRPDVNAALLGLALAVSVLGFTVREFALVSTAAILLGWGLHEWPMSRPAMLRIGTAVVLIAAVVCLLLAWRRTVTPISSTAGLVPRSVLGSARSLAATLMTLAELTAPALLLGLVAAAPLMRRIRLRVLGGLVVVAVGAWLVVRGGVNLNYVTPNGPYAITAGPGAPRAYPEWGDQIKRGTLLLAALGAALLIAARLPSPLLWKQVAGRPSIGVSLSLFYGAGVLLGAWLLDAVAGVYAWDRYFAPAVPYLVAVSVMPMARLRWRLIGTTAAMLLAGWSLFGLHYVDLAATQDGTTWRLARTVNAMGYPAEVIDGGMEWFGLHQRSQILQFPSAPPNHFWTALFAHPRICVVVHYPGHPFDVPSGATTRQVAEATGISALGVRYTLVADEVSPGCRQ